MKCKWHNKKLKGCELRRKPCDCEGDTTQCWFPELLNMTKEYGRKPYNVPKRRKEVNDNG